VVLVLLHERLVVRAAVLCHEPRRLARLGLQLRQLRPQRRHGDLLAVQNGAMRVVRRKSKERKGEEIRRFESADAKAL